LGDLFTTVQTNIAAQVPPKACTEPPGVLSPAVRRWAGRPSRIVTQPYFHAGVTICSVSLIAWILGLPRRPASIALSLRSPGCALNTLVAYLLFGESLTAAHRLGIDSVVPGVQRVAHA
jgi:multidrug transporter EmrE-like cation transporter